MKQVQTPLKLIIAGTVVAAACVIAAPSASAQDATMSTTDAAVAPDAATSADSADAFTVAPPQTFSATGKPTSSTPRMVQEAIQRSQARSEKLRTQGVKEQWGSEEPFTLVDHRGKPVTDRDFLGKPALVFFGFTHCPDVCPTTLYELSNLLAQLKSDADRLNVLFITVDPERDTPEQLALYLSSFDPRITGLSGTSEGIAAAVDAYQAYSRKVPLKDGGYTMDHTAAIFMMDGKGRYVGTLSHRETDAALRAKLRRLLDSAHS
jgi:protein SCO1